MAAQIVACGTSTSSSSGTTSSGDDSSSGSDDSSGSSDSNSSNFTLSGTLSTLTVSSSSSSLLAVATSGMVTDVMAVSPETGDVTRTTASVGSDGTFSLPVARGRPWILIFLDRLRRGRNMFLGRFRSSTLDTVTSNCDTAGTADLGIVDIEGSTGIATSENTDQDELEEDLCLDSETADNIGEVDDVASRYGNPDIDGDGEIDSGQSNRNFMLDFHVRFFMLVGSRTALVSDVIDSYLDDDTPVSYSGTGVYVAYPTAYSSVDEGTVTFTDSDVTTEEGGCD